MISYSETVVYEDPESDIFVGLFPFKKNDLPGKLAPDANPLRMIICKKSEEGFYFIRYSIEIEKIILSFLKTKEKDNKTGWIPIKIMTTVGTRPDIGYQFRNEK